MVGERSARSSGRRSNESNSENQTPTVTFALAIPRQVISSRIAVIKRAYRTKVSAFCLSIAQARRPPSFKLNDGKWVFKNLYNSNNVVPRVPLSQNCITDSSKGKSWLHFRLMATVLFSKTLHHWLNSYRTLVEEALYVLATQNL
ncbi:hypothetical protein CHS0354_009428 [Potamilus streckersoni]|uniref:Uncharacterized protein n=1 Tax=Potamilus streckersoni TaxID=2493646 RepID=A0AAE0T439_9BIVA|nr:hypothetical protein CHS0354_009428 [Potamilus streckersoni]